MVDIKIAYNEYLDTVNKYESKEGYFSASSAGSCHRKQYYKLHNYEQSEIDPRVKRLLALGHIVHKDIQASLKDIQDIEIEREINIPRLKVVGHSDIIEIKGNIGKITDIKTVAAYKWRTMFGLKKNRRPGSDTNYKLQLGTYGLGLLEEFPDLELELWLLWYNKNDSAVKHQYVSNDNMGMAEDYWEDLNESLEGVTDPEELVPGDINVPVENWECSYCWYKQYCPGVSK